MSPDTKAPPSFTRALESALPPKADMDKYGFQLTTNQKGEFVYLRPLSVLDKKEVDDNHMTDFDVLDLLEARALSVLNAVVEQRRVLTENLKKAIMEMQAGRKPS